MIYEVELAQDAYIQHIQYMETHPEEEAGEFG